MDIGPTILHHYRTIIMQSKILTCGKTRHSNIGFSVIGAYRLLGLENAEIMDVCRTGDKSKLHILLRFNDILGFILTKVTHCIYSLISADSTGVDLIYI